MPLKYHELGWTRRELVSLPPDSLMPVRFPTVAARALRGRGDRWRLGLSAAPVFQKGEMSLVRQD